MERPNQQHRVVVTGSSGLIGRALCSHLTAQGFAVERLVRREPQSPGEIAWDPARGELDAQAISGAVAVIHLAGQSVSRDKWTRPIKQAIRDSRVESTKLLVAAIQSANIPPAVFICASAIGYYGNRGDAELTESSEPGKNFLAEVCEEWEAASQQARKGGLRLLNARIGVVLATEGGALARMLPAFKLGGGGPLGNGKQYYSWIGLSDLVRALEFCLITPALTGPVNLCAPNPVTNAEFARTLGGAVGRPAKVPVPAPMCRMLFGEMGEALLLASARVQPKKLQAAGFRFEFPLLPAALQHELNKV